MAGIGIKPTVEILYRDELEALKGADKYNKKPENWYLSPKAVRTFILGSGKKSYKLNDKEIYIKQKYYGDDALIERCIITLAGNRGLMLVGEPGTAKTMLSELLCAAICATSLNTVQGTAGTSDDNIKYSWNYALLLAKGATEESLIPAPLYTGMAKGIITRFEEITRCSSEVQDTLISVMSDKVMSIPEFGEDGVLFAKAGFNIIGTANTRDRGVNEMSSALKRRFNFETVFPINNVKLESKIIREQCTQMLGESAAEFIDVDVIDIIATTFHELREGVSGDGVKIDTTTAVMSTAEAVSVYYQSALSSYYYDCNNVDMDVVMQNMMGAILKENREDVSKIKVYFESVIKNRSKKQGGKWKDFYEARKWVK